MPDKSASKTNSAKSTDSASFSIKKLSSFFVDEVANISIAPNGACRLSFATWSTDNEGQAQRIDSEVILTITTLKSLANALSKAIEQSEKVMAQRQVSSQTSSKTVQ